MSKQTEKVWHTLLFILLFYFQQWKAKLAAENWGPLSTSPMATAPASTPLRSWFVPASVSPLRCSQTGSAVHTAGSCGAGGAAARTGGALTTRHAPSAFSCSVRTAAPGHTRSLSSRRVSARGTHGSTMSREVRLRSRFCRRHSSCTSPRARGNYARTNWWTTGMKLSPEQTRTQKPESPQQRTVTPGLNGSCVYG